MSETKTHTPGPWVIEWDQVDEEWPAWLEDGPGTHLATFEDASRADAFLIAAAPDLLEAARDALYLLERISMQGHEHVTEGRDTLRAAIAKAEGMEA